jgi:hypothetical protein
MFWDPFGRCEGLGSPTLQLPTLLDLRLPRLARIGDD